MALTAEGKVKAAVDRILKRYGAWYVKPVSNGMGKMGVPDYLVCYMGQFIAIECKGTDKGKPTPLQQIQMGLIHAAGGTTYIATPSTVPGLDVLLAMMKEGLHETTI